MQSKKGACILQPSLVNISNKFTGTSHNNSVNTNPGTGRSKLYQEYNSTKQPMKHKGTESSGSAKMRPLSKKGQNKSSSQEPVVSNQQIHAKNMHEMPNLQNNNKAAANREYMNRSTVI